MYKNQKTVERIFLILLNPIQNCWHLAGCQTVATLCKYRFKDLFDFLDPPQPVLKLGTPLFKDGIKEGDDVYFECFLFKSNPAIHKLTWMLNVCFFVITTSNKI